VLLVESEHDDYVPHTTLMSYRAAFEKAHSLTHRMVDGADHALSQDSDQKAYTSILTSWVSEMIIGARTADYPHHSAIYS
jgi:dienelactone hydrolase